MRNQLPVSASHPNRVCAPPQPRSSWPLMPNCRSMALIGACALANGALLSIVALLLSSDLWSLAHTLFCLCHHPLPSSSVPYAPVCTPRNKPLPISVSTPSLPLSLSFALQSHGHPSFLLFFFLFPFFLLWPGPVHAPAPSFLPPSRLSYLNPCTALAHTTAASTASCASPVHRRRRTRPVHCPHTSPTTARPRPRPPGSPHARRRPSVGPVSPLPLAPPAPTMSPSSAPVHI